MAKRERELDPREFTTLPLRALGDRRLSGIDLRVLGAISLHDGMSLALGRGQGCWAGDRRLAKVANTDRKNVKRSTSRLLECGYLIKDDDTLNRRGFVVRVIPDSMANRIGGQVTPYANSTDHESGTSSDPVGGQATPSEQGASSPPIGGEMTPSIGGEVTPRIEREYNQEESHIINSPEGAHIADRDMRHEQAINENVIEFPTRENSRPEPARSERCVDRLELADLVEGAIRRFGTARALAKQTGLPEQVISTAKRARHLSAGKTSEVVNALEALPTAQRSIFTKLPDRFFDLESSAQIPILERTLRTIDYADLPQCERQEIEGLLESIMDAYEDTPTGERAKRIYCQLPS